MAKVPDPLGLYVILATGVEQKVREIAESAAKVKTRGQNIEPTIKRLNEMLETRDISRQKLVLGRQGGKALQSVLGLTDEDWKNNQDTLENLQNIRTYGQMLRDLLETATGRANIKDLIRFEDNDEALLNAFSKLSDNLSVRKVEDEEDKVKIQRILERLSENYPDKVKFAQVERKIEVLNKEDNPVFEEIIKEYENKPIFYHKDYEIESERKKGDTTEPHFPREREIFRETIGKVKISVEYTEKYVNFVKSMRKEGSKVATKVTQKTITSKDLSVENVAKFIASIPLLPAKRDVFLALRELLPKMGERNNNSNLLLGRNRVIQEQFRSLIEQGDALEDPLGDLLSIGQQKAFADYKSRVASAKKYKGLLELQEDENQYKSFLEDYRRLKLKDSAQININGNEKIIKALDNFTNVAFDNKKEEDIFFDIDRVPQDEDGYEDFSILPALEIDFEKYEKVKKKYDLDLDEFIVPATIVTIQGNIANEGGESLIQFLKDFKIGKNQNYKETFESPIQRLGALIRIASVYDDASLEDDWEEWASGNLSEEESSNTTSANQALASLVERLNDSLKKIRTSFFDQFRIRIAELVATPQNYPRVMESKPLLVKLRTSGLIKG